MGHDESGGRFRRALKRLSATADEMDADALDQERVVQGCSQIKGLRDREYVTVYGNVKNVSLAPRAGTPTPRGHPLRRLRQLDAGLARPSQDHRRQARRRRQGCRSGLVPRRTGA